MSAITSPQPQTVAIPGTWAIGRRRIVIELKQFFRDGNSALWNFAFPMILLVIFGSVFGGQDIGPDITFTQYFVAGMIASGVLYTSFQNLAIAIPLEREDGTLKRLGGTPMPKVSYFIGKIGTVFVAYTAQVTILIAVGVLFYDISLPSTTLQWFTFLWASLLGLVSCTLLGIAFSVVPKNGKGASAVVSPIVLVLQFTLLLGAAAAVAGAGDAQRVPARVGRRHRGVWRVGAGDVRARAVHLGSRRPGALDRLLPLDAPRLQLAVGHLASRRSAGACTIGGCPRGTPSPSPSARSWRPG